MSRWIWLLLCCSASAGAQTQSAPVISAMETVTLTCSDRATRLCGDIGSVFSVTCPAGCEKGAVYGSGTYSDDSSVCRAAIHSGVIAPAGGTFYLTLAAGQKTYLASTLHGVTSAASGKHACSFTLAAMTMPVPTTTPEPRRAPPSAAP